MTKKPRVTWSTTTTPPKGVFVYEPEVAAATFTHDKTRVFFNLGEICRVFGLTGAELIGELRAGRLAAHGIEVKGGYDAVSVRGDSLVAWLTCGSPIADKAAANLAAGHRELKR